MHHFGARRAQGIRPKLGLGRRFPDHVRGPFGKHIELLRSGLTLVGPPIELLGKLPVKPGKVNAVGVLSALALFHRARSVIVGIVRHGGRTS